MTSETMEASVATVDAKRVGLERHGLEPQGQVHRNLAPARLYEESFARGEAHLVHMGAIATVTAPHTGRSPNDRFVVKDEQHSGSVDWGKVNVAISPEHYEALREDVVAHLNGRDLFVHDARAGCDDTHGIDVRVISEAPWYALFAHNMFLRLDERDLRDFEPQFTLLHAPHLKADPARHGCRTETAIVVNFSAHEVVVAGTKYAGEIKKSVFSVLNYLLPDAGVFPMHCSANVGPEGDVALFFGLSGTGKTTLSSDPTRTLIGDDEHGWSDHGVFNFEGGCYAKVINLSADGEPEIYATTQRSGTILENVVLDDDGNIDLDDDSITENTRGSYPISYIPNASPDGTGSHPRDVVFLTADAFGVLPPIARLTTEQARYYFLSGYTAKVAGTERGVTDPEATFSVCFGAPFLPLPPQTYSQMLGERITKHGVRVWLVNTGWTGGPFGVGERMKLSHTRAILRAALDGALDDVPTQREPNFGLDIPTTCPDVPDEVLRPRDTWDDPEAYDGQARRLAAMFRENFRAYTSDVPKEVVRAGPPA